MKKIIVLAMLCLLLTSIFATTAVAIRPNLDWVSFFKWISGGGITGAQVFTPFSGTWTATGPAQALPGQSIPLTRSGFSAGDTVQTVQFVSGQIIATGAFPPGTPIQYTITGAGGSPVYAQCQGISFGSGQPLQNNICPVPGGGVVVSGPSEEVQNPNPTHVISVNGVVTFNVGGVAGSLPICGNNIVESPETCELPNSGSQNCGVGACAVTTQTCDSVCQSVTCVPGTPVAEICGNFADDDCDGTVDECGRNIGQPVMHAFQINAKADDSDDDRGRGHFNLEGQVDSGFCLMIRAEGVAEMTGDVVIGPKTIVVPLKSDGACGLMLDDGQQSGAETSAFEFSDFDGVPSGKLDINWVGKNFLDQSQTTISSGAVTLTVTVNDLDNPSISYSTGPITVNLRAKTTKIARGPV